MTDKRAHVGLKPGVPGVCETVLDHDFQRYVIIDTGRHPTRGPYQTMVKTCRKCTREIAETYWLQQSTAAAAMSMLGDAAAIAQTAVFPRQKSTDEED